MEYLKKRLLHLKENNCLVGIKGGTEVEGMSFQEILEMRKVSLNIVPMTVKIGGPEARNDIDYMLSIGIDKILAPMIESPYSLKNFVLTVNEMDKEKKAALAINIETITAYKNLESIVNSEHFEKISQVTVGRTDLSGSMNKTVDDEEVNKITKNIVELSKLYNKITSTGGKIDTTNAPVIQKSINPDYINTRNLTVTCKSKNISEDIKEILLWEKDFFSYLLKKFPSRAAYYNERVHSAASRLNNKLINNVLS